jgi:hypothetical protein
MKLIFVLDDFSKIKGHRELVENKKQGWYEISLKDFLDDKFAWITHLLEKIWFNEKEFMTFLKENNLNNGR